MTTKAEQARAILAAATPGPWQAAEVGRVVSYHEPEGYEVADCMAYRYEEDARAIALAHATAGPALDLYEAVRAIAGDADDDRSALITALDRFEAVLREALKAEDR